MSRATSFGLAVLTAFLASPAASQTATTVPAEYATLAGNSQSEDLGLDRIRSMAFIDNQYVKGLVKKQITELRYRRDENVNKFLGVTYEPMTRKPVRTTIPAPTWRVRIGTYNGNVLNPPVQYAPRTGGPIMTLIFNSKLNFDTNSGHVAMPNLALPSSGLPKFEIKFPFSSKVLFNGPHMVIDHFTYNRANYRYRYYVDSIETDYNQSRGGSVELISSTSTGCPKGANRVVGHAPNPGAGNLTLYLNGSQPNKRSVCIFGGGSASWGNIKLPWSLTFMGLPGCNVYTDLSQWYWNGTNNAGYSAINIPVPALSQYVGLQFYAQWLVEDSRVNSVVGFAASDGVKIKLGPKLGTPTLRMSVLSGASGYADNTVGFVQLGRGYVFQAIH